MSPGDFRQGVARVGELEVHYLEAGDGPLLLCLHGFPDTPITFAAQLEAFAAAGYRVVAPYMRGYPPTGMPEGGTCQPAALASDVLGLIGALGAEQASVYGHDWGSVAAHAAAVLGPERIDKLVTCAVPYGPGMGKALLTSPDQQRRSWYIFFFQTALAELAVPHDGFAFIDALWRDWSPGWRFSPEHLAHVKATLAQPGALRAALSYYRTSLDASRRDPALAEREARVGREPITVPTLYLHGADDGCIGSEVSEGADTMFTGGYRRVIVDGAGHFVHAELPAWFNTEVLAFLRS